MEHIGTRHHGDDRQIVFHSLRLMLASEF